MNINIDPICFQFMFAKHKVEYSIKVIVCVFDYIADCVRIDSVVQMYSFYLTKIFAVVTEPACHEFE